MKEAGAEGQDDPARHVERAAAAPHQAQAVQSAARVDRAEGQLVSVSAPNYINFFIDPAARKDVDGFFTVNYSNTADPLRCYVALSLPDGSQDFNGYANPKATREMEARARGRRHQAGRAWWSRLQKIITDEMLWVPMVAPDHGAGHEQGHHRRAGDVPVHVRSLGGVRSARPDDGAAIGC